MKMSSHSENMSTSTPSLVKKTLDFKNVDVVEYVLNGVKKWSFNKLPGANVSDESFKTLATSTFNDYGRCEINYGGRKYVTCLNIFGRVFDYHKNKFTEEFKVVTAPDFIKMKDMQDNLMMVFLRSLNVSAMSFPRTVEKIMDFCVIPTEKGLKISILNLLFLNPVLQFGLMSNIDQVLAKPRPLDAIVNNNCMRGFNRARSMRASSVLAEEIRVAKLRRQIPSEVWRFYRKNYDTNIRGASINKRVADFKMLAGKDKLPVTAEMVVAMLAFPDFSRTNCALEKTMASTSCSNAINTVFSKPSERLVIPDGVESIANYHINKHLDNNDHHPQYHERMNTKVMTPHQTIEVICDLASCAIHQGAANIKEALYIITKWLLNDKFEIIHKYRKLEPFGIMIALMRFEVLFENSSDFAGVHRTRDWRSQLFWTEAKFIEMYNSDFTPRWKDGPLGHYYKETTVHVHLVNTLLRSFGIKAKHDADKFEYYCMIAYTAKWGTCIKEDPVLTMDEILNLSKHVDTLDTTLNAGIQGIRKDLKKTSEEMANLLNAHATTTGEDITAALEDITGKAIHSLELADANLERVTKNTIATGRVIREEAEKLTLEVATTGLAVKDYVKVVDEKTQLLSEKAQITIEKLEQLVDLAMERLMSFTNQTSETMRQLPHTVTAGVMANLAAFLAPLKSVLTGMSSMIRSAFDQVYDLFAKICLPPRQGRVLNQFSDVEILEVLIIMVAFYKTENVVFKLLLAYRLCLIFEVAEKLANIYESLKTKLMQWYEYDPTEPTETDDTEELPQSFFGVVVSLLTNPSPITVAALLSTVAVGYFGVSAACQSTKTFSQTVVQSLRNIGFSAMGIAALPKLMEVFSMGMDYLKKMHDNVKEGKKSVSVVESNSKVTAVLAKCATLKCDEVLFSVYRHQDSEDYARQTLAELDDLMAKFGNEEPFAPTLYASLSRYRTELNGLRNYLLKPAGCRSRRVTPFSVQFYGESQLGKSQCMNAVASAIERYFYNTSTPGSEIYARNPSDAYMTEYRQQKIWMKDDIFMIFSPEEIAEFIGIVSSVPMYLNMADLKDKGLDFVSEFCITSTNTPDPEQQDVRYMDAVRNRRHALWNVVPVPAMLGKKVCEESYQDAGLDWSKASEFAHLKFKLRCANNTDRWYNVVLIDGVPDIVETDSVSVMQYDYKQMLDITIAMGKAHIINEKAQITMAVNGPRLESYKNALELERVYGELIRRYPSLIKSVTAPGVPVFTHEKFSQQFMNMLEDRGNMTIPTMLKTFTRSIVEQYVPEAERDPEETGMASALLSDVAKSAFAIIVNYLIYRDPTCFKRYMAHAAWAKFTGIMLDILINDSYFVKKVKRMSKADLLSELRRMFVFEEADTVSDEILNFTSSRHNQKDLNTMVTEILGLPLVKHPFFLTDDPDVYVEACIIPLCNQVDTDLAMILNLALVRSMFPPSLNHDRCYALALANLMFYKENPRYYDKCYDISCGEGSSPSLKVPSNLPLRIINYVHQSTVGESELAELDNTVAYPSFNYRGRDEYTFVVRDYNFPLVEMAEPSGEYAYKINELMGNSAHGETKIDIRVLKFMTEKIENGQSMPVIDMFLWYAEAYPDVDMFGIDRSSPRMAWLSLMRKLPCSREVFKHTITAISQLPTEEFRKLLDYRDDYLEGTIVTIRNFQMILRDVRSSTTVSQIPTNWNKLELLYQSKFVTGILLVGSVYGVYKTLTSIINFWFPPKPETTSKLMQRYGKIGYLRHNVTTTNTEEPVECSASENEAFVSKRMINGAIQIILHTDTSNITFNGFAFNQNILTCAHPFLHGEYHKREEVEVSVMTGDLLDPETYPRFVVHRKNMVFDPHSDRVLIRIPRMRFFRNLPLKCFYTEDQLSKGVFHNETMYGFSFVGKELQTRAICGTRYVNKPKVVTSSIGLSLPNYLIFNGALEKGTSGSLFYIIGKDNVVHCMGIQSCHHNGSSFLAPVTREWIAQAMNTLNQHSLNVEHSGPLTCCDEQPRSRIVLNGNIPLVGAVPIGLTINNMTRTNYRKSMISEDFETGEIPAILDPKDPLIPDGKHPLQHSANKWSISEMVEPENRLIERAIHDVTSFMRAKLQYPKFETDYTWEEVILGHSSPLALNTSAGLPYVLDRYNGKPKGKKAYMNINELGEVDFLDEEFVQDCEFLEGSLDNKIIPKNSNYVFSKDELRPKEKVIGPPVKTRSISVMSQAFTLVYRKYMMDYESALTTIADGTQPYCVGISPESPAGNTMYQNMLTVGDVGFDLDVPHWDGHFPPWLMLAVLEHVRLMYGWPKESKEYRVMYGIIMNCLFGFEQLEDLVYQKPGGMPSGFAGTACWNTLGHLLLFYILYLMICEQQSHKHLANWHAFRTYMCLFLYGDDVHAVVSNEVKEWLNANTFAEAYANLGWPVTTADKAGERVPYKPLSELTFLKRSWIENEMVPGYYQTALSDRTIDRLCEWYRTGEDDEVQQIENFYTYLEFSYYHGREYYTNNLYRLNTALENKFKPRILIDFNQMEAIIAARTWQEINGLKKNDLLFGKPIETSDEHPLIPLYQRVEQELDDLAEVTSTEELTTPTPSPQIAQQRRVERLGTNVLRQCVSMIRPLGTDWALIAMTIVFAILVIFRARR